MTNRRMIAVTDPTVPDPADVSAGHVPTTGHAEPDTSTGHEDTETPAANLPDMTTANGETVPADMFAEYVIERRQPAGNAAAVTWATIATGSVRLDAPGADGVETFVDAMARTARASLLDSSALRISAFVRATGDAAYTEIPPAGDPTTRGRTPRRSREVGRFTDTQRKRRRTQHRGL